MALSRRACLSVLATAATVTTLRRARAAETFTLGLLHTLSPAPFYIAREQGYFTEEGVDVTFRFFEAAQPIAAAAVAGDIDVGVTALTGGFFSLAGRGALKVIGGALHEQKGFELTAVLVSKKAYDAGLTSIARLGGHSFGLTQYGSSFHYMVGRLAEAAGFDIKTVTLRPLQQISNMVAAVRTGQVDATMAIASMAVPAAASGDARIIGWVGDLVPYQITALFTTRQMIERRADALRKFCRGYQRGVADYRAAFLAFDAEHKPLYGPATEAVDPGDREIRLHRRSERGAEDQRRHRLVRRGRGAGCGRRSCPARLVPGAGDGEGPDRSRRHHRHLVPADEMSGSSVRLQARDVGHAFGSLAVLDGIDLDVAAGRGDGSGRAVRLRQVDAARASSAECLHPARGEVRMEGAVARRLPQPADLCVPGFFAAALANCGRQYLARAGGWHA